MKADGSGDLKTGTVVTGTFTKYQNGLAVQTIALENLQIDLVDPATGNPVDDPVAASQLNFTTAVADAGTIVWQTESVYDEGRLVQSIGRHAPGEDGPETDYLYDDLGRQWATIGPAVYDEVAKETVRHRTETVYDDETGRVAETWSNLRVVIDSDGIEQAPDYANKQVTAYTYDAEGRTVKTTQVGYENSAVALTISTNTRYDAQGRVVAESDPYYETAQTAVEWSATAGSFVDTADNDAVIPTKRYEYDTVGRMSAVILPEVKDPSGSVDEVNPRYEYTYDARGNVTTIRDNVVHVSTGVGDYDHDGQLGDDTRVTAFTYDALGRQLTRTLPLGVALGSGFVETTVYDDHGRTLKQTSFEGVVTRFVYDDAEFGRLVEKLFFVDSTAHDAWVSDPVTYPPQEKEVFSYDEFGRETSVTQTLTTHTRVTQNEYDEYGRLVTVTADVDGNATTDEQINYVYDSVHGWLVRTYTGSKVTGGAATGDGSAVTDTVYTYDTLGRLDSVIVQERFDEPLAAPEVTDYSYDLVGNLVRCWTPDDIITVYEYDTLNRLDVQTNYAPQVYSGDPDDVTVRDVLGRFDYEVDAKGKRAGVSETLGYDTDGDTYLDVTETIEIDWIYDNLGRLVREVYDSSDDTRDFVADYVFDLVGNRLEKKTDLTPNTTEMDAYHTDAVDGAIDVALAEINEHVLSAYDLNDRLLSELKDLDGWEDDRLTVYGYDSTQQISKSVHATTVDDGLTTADPVVEQTDYTYNLQGRMASAEVSEYDSSGQTLQSHNKSTYEYDDSGIRVAKTDHEDVNKDGDFDDAEDTSERTDYHVDHRNPTGYAQVLEEMQGGAVVKSYTIGHDVFLEAVAANDARRLLKDGHGSTRALVDATGTVLSNSGEPQIYAYDAYGNPIGYTPSLALTTHLYSGEQTDQLTGLQYLRARYYNPATGRFNRLDPFAGNFSDPQSLHKYLYVHGDPVNGVDPTGRFLAGMISVTIGNIGQIKDVTATQASRFVLELGAHAAAGASLGVVVQNIFGGISWTSAGTGAYYGAVLGAGFYLAGRQGSEKLTEAIASGIITGAMNTALGVARDLQEFGYNMLPEYLQLRLHPQKQPAHLWGPLNKGVVGVYDGFTTGTIGVGIQAFFQGFALGVWNEATEVFSGGTEEFADAAWNFVDTYINTVAAQASGGQSIDHGSALSLSLLAAATDLVQFFFGDEISDELKQMMAGAVVGAGFAMAESVGEAMFGVNIFDSETRFA